MKTQYVESLVIESTFATSLYLRRVSFFSSSSVMMINPTRNTTERMEVERTIVSSDEVGRAAPPYIHEVR
jgi:hypothetical protein